MKIIVTALAAALALSACSASPSTKTPEGTVEAFYKAMQDENTSGMAKLLQCPGEAVVGLAMAKAFGMDIAELSKSAKITGPAVLSEGGAKATVPVTSDFGNDTQDLVKVNKDGNLAPTNGTWKLACDEDSK